MSGLESSSFLGFCSRSAERKWEFCRSVMINRITVGKEYDFEHLFHLTANYQLSARRTSTEFAATTIGRLLQPMWTRPSMRSTGRQWLHPEEDSQTPRATWNIQEARNQRKGGDEWHLNGHGQDTMTSQRCLHLFFVHFLAFMSVCSTGRSWWCGFFSRGCFWSLVLLRSKGTRLHDSSLTEKVLRWSLVEACPMNGRVAGWDCVLMVCVTLHFVILSHF